MGWAGHVVSMGKMRNTYIILFGKPEGKRQFRRPRRGWEDKIKMNFRKTGFKDVDWIHLVQDMKGWPASGSTVTKLRVT